MSAILFDGFDHGDHVHRWTIAGSSGPLTEQVRTGTHAYRMAGGGNLYLALDSAEEDDVMYVGFGFYAVPDLESQVTLEISENFGAISHLTLIKHGGVRGWEVKRGAGLSLVLGTSVINVTPNVYFPNSWHYIELGAKIHDSAGWVELRQDGVAIGRFDGDTSNGGVDNKIDRVLFRVENATHTYYLDDVYILNEQGSVNNSWLGDTRCFPLYPNGNGNYSQLVGSDADSTDNWMLVDETGTPNTSDYVGSATPGDKDSYTFEDLPVTLGTIRGVEVRMHAAKDDTGTKQIRAITRRLGTDSFGPDHVLAAIPLWQTHHDVDELDPHAGPGAWTITNINATEWGVEVRA